MAATGLGFIITVVLARLLGVSGFGIYTYAIAWTELLILIATLGLDNLTVREVAIYQTKSQWGLMRGLLRWSNQIALAASVTIAIAAVGVAWSVGMADDNPQMFLAFCVAMILIPIATLRNLRLAAMRGLHQIVMGLLPEMILTPLLLIVFVAWVYSFLGEGLTAPWMTGIRVAAATITLAIGMRLLQRILPDGVKEAKPEYEIRGWLHSAIPLMFLGSMFVIKSRTDILMLGAMQGAEAAGIYLAVNRGVQLINFVVNAVNTALGPNIASLYAEGKIDKVQRILSKSSGLVLLVALPVTIGLIALSHWYLLLFGSEFMRGENALIILCVGQMVNAATCSVSLLLNMTKHERYTLITGGTSTVLNVILNAVLIPIWGVTGAALATASTLVLERIANAIVIRKKLGIRSTAIGL